MAIREEKDLTLKDYCPIVNNNNLSLLLNPISHHLGLLSEKAKKNRKSTSNGTDKSRP